jgi:hypothetical protein
MDPMNSIWYYLEFQRQSSANRFSPFAKPETRPRKSLKSWIMELLVPPVSPSEPRTDSTSLKSWIMELLVPLFVVAALVTFGVVCFLCPTFVS